MPNASKVDITETDKTFQVIVPEGGIQALAGESQRGKYGAQFMSSWANFLKEYGGEYMGNETITHIKMIYQRGGQVIFNKLGHYTDIADVSTLTALKAAMRFGARTWYIRLNGPLAAGNSISLNVGAVVTTNFATNNDTTLASFVASLEANSNVAAATAVNIVGSTGSDDRAIILVMATAQVPTTLVVTGPTGSLDIANFVLGSVNEKLFSLTPKNPGVKYNDIVFDITAASNGSPNYFNLTIRNTTDSTLPTETYEDLTIPGNTDVANSKYLQKVVESGKIASVTYYDLSATTGQQRPINNTYIMEGGTDGGTVTETDAIGDQAAKTGLYAFDPFEDMTFIAVPQFQTPAMAIAGSTYSKTRADVIYVVDIPISNVTAQDHIDFRDSTSIDDKYSAFIGGGATILDTPTGQEKDISSTGAFLAAHSANDAGSQGKPWRSVASTSQGQVLGTLGAVRDFGSSGSFPDLNRLAKRQIMMIGTRDKVRCILGNYSGQLANSKLSFLSIVKLLIYIKKALKPTLNRYLEKPNIPRTWKDLYNEVKPFLDDLTLAEKEALISYDWQGDQFSTLADLEADNLPINNAADIDAGKYKIKLKIKTVSPIIEIDLEIILTPTSASFSDNL